MDSPGGTRHRYSWRLAPIGVWHLLGFEQCSWRLAPTGVSGIVGAWHLSGWQLEGPAGAEGFVLDLGQFLQTLSGQLEQLSQILVRERGFLTGPL